ncbi:hypothetical protein LZC95_11910 [Pendulispora brunnea]|uniref:Uncharacterized protein n=1 Tax=Pendulispora brunnea TaxID=2905690 RepID=A0ABZ2KKC3_9BACT
MTNEPPRGNELATPGALIEENYVVPSFARSFPRNESLDDLVRAFASGNYRKIHVQAPELASRATDPAVRDAARVLLERLQPDPLAKIILLAAVMLLAVMATWWITEARSHGGAGHHVRGGVSESTKALVES